MNDHSVADATDKPTPSIHEFLADHGSSFQEIREYSRRRAALLTGLADAVRTRINGPLQAHVGTTDDANRRRP